MQWAYLSTDDENTAQYQTVDPPRGQQFSTSSGGQVPLKYNDRHGTVVVNTLVLDGTKKKFKDEEQTHNSYTPQFAGPLRIPPESFQIRVRKETSTRDTVNSRSVETWNSAVPVQQTDYIRQAQFTESESGNLSPVYMDMAPLSSRIDKRDFRQSQPYVVDAPNLAMNPFFDRYDPTRDPRNMLREVRSAVYELKEADRGLQESEKIRERIFADRYSPEGETPIKLTEWFDLLRPKIDNPEIVYRNQSQLWKLGSK